jgi:hypothetical protein
VFQHDTFSTGYRFGESTPCVILQAWPHRDAYGGLEGSRYDSVLGGMLGNLRFSVGCSADRSGGSHAGRCPECDRGGSAVLEESAAKGPRQLAGSSWVSWGCHRAVYAGLVGVRRAGEFAGDGQSPVIPAAAGRSASGLCDGPADHGVLCSRAEKRHAADPAECRLAGTGPDPGRRPGRGVELFFISGPSGSRRQLEFAIRAAGPARSRTGRRVGQRGHVAAGSGLLAQLPASGRFLGLLQGGQGSAPRATNGQHDVRRHRSAGDFPRSVGRGRRPRRGWGDPLLLRADRRRSLEAGSGVDGRQVHG